MEIIIYFNLVLKYLQYSDEFNFIFRTVCILLFMIIITIVVQLIIIYIYIYMRVYIYLYIYIYVMSSHFTLIYNNIIY